MMNRKLLAVLAGAAFVALSIVGTASAVQYIRTDENVSMVGSAYPAGAVIDLAAAATTTSSPLEMRVLTGMSVQVDHNAAAVGTLTLQSSNDGTTYYAVSGGGFTAITACGAPPCGEVVEIGAMRSRYYRFVYTHSSGTGDIKVTVHVKGK